MQKIVSKALVLSTLAFSLMAQPAFCLKLSDVVTNCKAVSKYWAFKKGESFHSGRKAAFFTIKGEKYEVSTFHVVGLENSKLYKNFGELVEKLKLSNEESKTIAPYKAFPDWKTEVFQVDLDDPKVTVVLSLRPVESERPAESEKPEKA